MKVFLTFSSLVLLAFLWPDLVLGGHHGRESPVHNVLVALRRAVEFYERDYCDINLDGIYGLRVAEGIVNMSLT